MEFWGIVQKYKTFMDEWFLFEHFYVQKRSYFYKSTIVINSRLNYNLVIIIRLAVINYVYCICNLLMI